MIVDVLSVFPEMFTSAMSSSIMARARKGGFLDFRARNLRDWTHDKHRSTDDEPFGGGAGQLMCCPPIFEALDELSALSPSPFIIFFTPCGKPLTQDIVRELSSKPRLLMVCGHYEGIDERAYTRAHLCLSLGDYILTGGELAAMVLTDAVCRLIPGVLGNERSVVEESFSADGLLEFAQYTRPASCRGMDVPEVLLSGDHERVKRWRRRSALERTARFRPDLLKSADLDKDERAQITELLLSDSATPDS